MTVSAASAARRDFAEFTAALAVLALVGNLAIALRQRRRRLSLIERALEAHRIESPG